MYYYYDFLMNYYKEVFLFLNMALREPTRSPKDCLRPHKDQCEAFTAREGNVTM